MPKEYPNGWDMGKLMYHRLANQKETLVGKEVTIYCRYIPLFQWKTTKWKVLKYKGIFLDFKFHSSHVGGGVEYIFIDKDGNRIKEYLDMDTCWGFYMDVK